MNYPRHIIPFLLGLAFWGLTHNEAKAQEDDLIFSNISLNMPKTRLLPHSKECPIPSDLTGPVKRVKTRRFPNVINNRPGVGGMYNVGWKIGKGKNAVFVPASNTQCPFAELALRPGASPKFTTVIYAHGIPEKNIRRFHRNISSFARNSEFKSVRKAGRSLPPTAAPRVKRQSAMWLPIFVGLSPIVAAPFIQISDMDPQLKIPTMGASLVAATTASLLMIRSTNRKWDRYHEDLTRYYLRVRAAQYKALEVEAP